MNIRTKKISCFCHFSTRTNQYRSSLVETTDQIYNVQRFKEACSLKSNDGDYLSRFETMLDGYEDKSADAVEDFAQMLVIFLNFLLCQKSLYLLIRFLYADGETFESTKISLFIFSMKRNISGRSSQID